jgi:hypothetical protein
MKLQKPKTLDEAWEIIQAQACLIEGLQLEIQNLKRELENIKKDRNKKDPPDFVKENVKKKRKKKKGPKSGHDFFGWFRSGKITERRRWFLKRCPDCDGPVSRSVEESKRIEIDVPPRGAHCSATYHRPSLVWSMPKACFKICPWPFAQNSF